MSAGGSLEVAEIPPITLALLYLVTFAAKNSSKYIILFKKARATIAPAPALHVTRPKNDLIKEKMGAKFLAVIVVR